MVAGMFGEVVAGVSRRQGTVTVGEPRTFGLEVTKRF
jgi:hypothetical protein